MELFRLLGTIAINNEEANAAISDTTGKAQQSGLSMTKVFGKIGNVAVKAGKVIASGVAVGSAAVGALTKASLDGYAEYEQLVGGIDTLFKDSNTKVMKYAENAYKTAGLSANEYMETVTSFSASLLQSLGGDTEQAAEMANTAITDMADNANKMGTDMASIQNAYQGFAKQNYTMLDNLKLGYGGTATEMARLINDSGVLGDQMIDLGNKQGIGAALAEVGYAKMIEAIHVVQTEMGITGTTAKEASSTIQGSVSSMKSSWKNLIVGIADDNQDLGTLIDNFVDSASTAVGNLIPRIEKILGGIGELITKLTPIIVSKLPGIINALIPGIISGATSLMTALISALPQILQLLIEQIPSILSQIGTALTETFPLLLDVVQELFGQLVDYIFNDVMGSSVDMGSVFTTLGEAFVNVYNQILPLITQISNNIIPFLLGMVQQLVPFISQIVQTILPTLFNWFAQLVPVFMQIVQAILPVIVDLVMKLLPPIIQIVDALLPVLVTIIEALLPIFQLLIDLLMPIIDLFISLIVPIVELIASAITPLINVISTLIQAVLTPLQPILDTLCNTIGSLLTPVINALSPAFQAVSTALSPLMELFSTLINTLLKPIIPLLEVIAEVVGTVLGGAFKALEPIITTIMDIFGGLIDFITGVFTGNWEMAWDGIVNIFKGIINLIPSAIEGIINGAIGLINGIIGGINKVTGWVGIPEIPKIPTVSLPKLEEGGVLEQGQVGILEGNGAEAVVPLEKNREWIGRVAEEMQVQGIGGSGKDTLTVLHDILAVLQSLKEDNANLPDTLVDAIANGLTFNINNREFARLVKAV